MIIGRSESSQLSVPTRFNPFDDSVLYEVVWPGSSFNKDENVNSIIVHTNNDESYDCVIPSDISDMINEDDLLLNGDISPSQLLDDVFLSNDCVYLVEGYWNYELCHGLHIRQFHEDRSEDGKVIKTLEYILGKYDDNIPHKPSNEESPPQWQYNGKDYPYYEVLFSNGAPCDIRDNVGRSARILYICDKDHGKIPSLVMVKESRTCEYEAIVVTSQLCHNKLYWTKSKPVYNIQCFSMNNSPREPRDYELFINDILIEEIVDEELDNTSPLPPTTPSSSTVDESFVKGFLNADFCLHGKSSGWWQHELCFGDHIKQVHLERGVVKQKIFLGIWDEEEHKKWFIKAGKSKQSSSHVTHLYVDGDLCDVTQQPRKSRVKFRCIPGGKSSQVSLYLEETTPCNYSMTIEAGFVCVLLETVNEYGLFHFTS